MLSELSNCNHKNIQSDEKMIVGKLEGKLVAAKLLLKQGMEWATIADLMDMTWEQIACVQRDFH